MKLYRFSPIQSEKTLLEAINHIHLEAQKLCRHSLGKILPNSGNMGVFCHYDSEWTFLTEIRKKWTEPSSNPNQKYFRLHQPIVIAAQNDFPETVYTHLYIRKPDPYRFHVGDVDFYLAPAEYQQLKQSLLQGKKIPGARVFDRSDLDMVELFDPDSDVLAYVSTEKQTQHVRVKQSDITKL